MNFVELNYLSLKKHKFTPSGYKGIGIEKLKFVTKTLFLSTNFSNVVFSIKFPENLQKIFVNNEKIESNN